MAPQFLPAICDDLIQHFDHSELHLLQLTACLHLQLHPLQVCLLIIHTQRCLLPLCTNTMDAVDKDPPVCLWLPATCSESQSWGWCPPILTIEPPLALRFPMGGNNSDNLEDMLHKWVMCFSYKMNWRVIWELPSNTALLNWVVEASGRQV